MITAPPPPAAMADAGPAPRDPLSRERWVVRRTRLAQSVKTRYAVSAVAVATALHAVLTGTGAHWAAVGCTLLPLLLNVAAHRALDERRSRAFTPRSDAARR